MEWQVAPGEIAAVMTNGFLTPGEASKELKIPKSTIKYYQGKILNPLNGKIEDVAEVSEWTYTILRFVKHLSIF